MAQVFADIMNISGEWLYNEEFDHGVSSGTVKLTHSDDDTISGEMLLLENESGQAPVYVKQTIQGLILDNKVIFKGKKFEILNGDKNTEYYLDSWEGIINNDGDIVGNTIDLNGACGVFIMKKL